MRLTFMLGRDVPRTEAHALEVSPSPIFMELGR